MRYCWSWFSFRSSHYEITPCKVADLRRSQHYFVFDRAVTLYSCLSSSELETWTIQDSNLWLIGYEPIVLPAELMVLSAQVPGRCCGSLSSPKDLCVATTAKRKEIFSPNPPNGFEPLSVFLTVLPFELWWNMQSALLSRSQAKQKQMMFYCRLQIPPVTVCYFLKDLKRKEKWN